MARAKTTAIRNFILDQVSKHQTDISRLVAEQFNITRQSVNYHVQALEKGGLLEAKGQTNARTYRLKVLSHREFRLALEKGLAEDKVWRSHMEDQLPKISDNVKGICYYGFTEMFNNVIDHSEGTEVLFSIQIDARSIQLEIIDNGVGIFDKIAKALHLEDRHHAIQELIKGKVTTDPERHTGEGIFFTSKMFDRFFVASSDLCFIHNSPDDDWLIEQQEVFVKGTGIRMSIRIDSKRTTQEIFDKYSDSEGDFGFSKTHVPVKLFKYGDENLVSRSQAKRLLARFEDFQEVLLDFEGVSSIGRAFADEIFRVFKNKHPHIKLVWMQATPSVEKTIRSALRGELPPPQPEDQLKFDFETSSSTESHH